MSHLKPFGRGARARHAALMIVALNAGAFACGRSDVLYRDDAFGAAAHASAGKATVGGSHNGGQGAVGNAGRGASGGGVSTGGSGGVSGSSGGSAVGGTFSSAGEGSGPYACAHVAPTCNSFTDFPAGAGITWGNGAFTGGFSVFGAGLVRSSDTSAFRVTGTVSEASGFTIWFSSCSDLSEFQGVEMTLSGTVGSDDMISFQPLTNDDYSWQSHPEDQNGACTSATPDDPFGGCIAPEVGFSVTGAPLLVNWTAIRGGVPSAWNVSSSTTQILGLRWSFPWSEGRKPYQVEVTLDDVFLWSGAGVVDCVSAAAGMGGMGGGAGSGTAGSGTAGSGTSSGGLSGTAGANQAGRSEAGAGAGGESGGVNEGGMSGASVAEGGTPNGGAPDLAGFGGI